MQLLYFFLRRAVIPYGKTPLRIGFANLVDIMKSATILKVLINQ